MSKDTNAILQNDGTSNGNIQGAGVVDLRMKHQSEYNSLSNFTPVGQPLPTQSGHSVENYLNQIEALPMGPEKNEPQDGSFVDTIKQRATIIATGRQQLQQQSSNILAAAVPTVKPDPHSTSNGEAHHIVSPLRSLNTSPLTIMNHVSTVVEHETISSPQQTTRTSPPVPVKTMLLEALLPTPQPLTISQNNATSVSATVVSEQSPDDNLLTTINTALLPPMQEPIVSSPNNTNGPVSVPSHNPHQVGILISNLII